MARFKIKEKKNEPKWLVQHRLAKQRKYDRKSKPTKHEILTPHPSLRDVWPLEN